MSPIYLVSGDNTIKINDYINKLTSSSIDSDIVSIDLEDSSLITLLDEINTIPFLNPSKIVIVKNPVVLYNPGKYDEKLIKSFIYYLRNPSDLTTVIFVVKDLKDINKELLQVLKETSIIEEISTPTDINVLDYINQSFQKDGYTLDNKVTEELISRTKGNVNRIEVEIEKLKTYRYDTKKILNIDVRLLVNKELDDNVFDLVNAVIENNTLKSYSIFKDLMTLNISETTIIALLISKFNDLYDTKVLTESGYSKNDIADLFRVKPGRIYYLQKEIGNVSTSFLKSTINYLTDLDYKIKSGQVDKRIGLELFLLRK